MHLAGAQVAVHDEAQRRELGGREFAVGFQVDETVGHGDARRATRTTA